MSITYYKDMIQGTDEWFEARAGCITASNINVLMTPKGLPAKNEKVRNYAYELVAQRETKRVEASFQSMDMERGQIQEDLAREIYSESYEEVEQCGFITRQFDGFKLGASPDGLVGEDGGIEIKSRLSKFQIKAIANDKIDPSFMNQIQTSLLVSGRQWWDFVQYSNGMPLFAKRVLPDQTRQQAILEAVVAFEELTNEIQARYQKNSVNLVQTPYVDLMMDDEINESEA